MVARAPSRWVIAGTVMTGTIMAALDGSIVNVALPQMSGTFGATIEEITWVVTGYMLSNVIAMPLIAWLSGRFGRKRMYVMSVVAFTAASMCCGLGVLNGEVTRQAVVLSYDHVFALVMLLFAIALPLVMLLRATGTVRDEATALIGE